MTLKGTGIRLTHDFGGRWSVCIDLCEDYVPMAKNAVDSMNGEISVDIKPFRNKRSIDANNYAWVLIGKIAVAMRTDKMTIYRQMIRDLGDNCDFTCVSEKASETFKKYWVSRGDGWLCDEVPCKIDGCVKYQIYYGSSSYDSHLMSAFIDRLVDEAHELGIDTLPEREITDLKNKWKN